MPEKMSRDAERTLVGALADIADRVNDGESPCGAIEKVARDAGLERGHVQLLVNAYNIGRTTRQREDGSSPAEKAADFELADAPTIFDRLYPSTVKSAATVAAESGVSGEYSRPPGWLARRYDTSEAVLEKAAAATALAPRPDPIPRDPSREARLKVADDHRRLRAADEARLEAGKAAGGALAKLADLAEYFATPGSLAMGDVGENVAILYGAAGTKVLEKVAGLRPDLAGYASRRKHHPVDARAMPYSAVESILKTSIAYEGLRADHAEKLAAIEDARPAYGPRSIVGPVKAGGLADWGTQAFQQVGQGFLPPEQDAAAEKTLRRIATPEHEARLAAIEGRADLSEMMNDDPTLKGYDAGEVARHFNRISQFAPAVGRQPLLAAPLVRKSVQQGQLDPFDAGEIAGSEQKLRAIHHQPKAEGVKRASRSILD